MPTDADLVEGKAARRAWSALEAASHRGERVPICVSSGSEQMDAELEGLLRMLGQWIRTRTEAEWSVVDLLTPGVRGQQKAVAEITVLPRRRCPPRLCVRATTTNSVPGQPSPDCWNSLTSCRTLRVL